MINFTWKILDIYSEVKSVHYLLSATNDQITISSEGNHTFSDGVVNMPFEQIKEENLIDWLNKDTTKDDINAIKLNLENQLEKLKNSQKVDLPWLADTFTPGS